ncbi:DNA topoisomerase IB [Lysobacter enzymogenes]|uniref:DNA topoisomerase IB n=1 Tax=Lysobacter enzymogenes TaxID=69 RepID=UPI0009D388FA|nr:DNA topoisomerase IB [Lysobacter enzymogenes]UZW58561.1 DNA topoisomerase IB [Lysobacter enzymogenes]
MASSPTSDRDPPATGLRYVDDDEPGFSRRRAGRGFAYRDARGRPVRAARQLERIRALAIPPAYTEVWICADPRGHLQATGRDARGRKQYRYHPRWRALRERGKFERIVAFAAALPALRRRVRADLALPGLPRSKVLAIVVAVMAHTLVRVGNDEYQRSNGSFGLTTLRKRHLQLLRGGRAQLAFRGKGGLRQQIELDDARLVRLVRRCRQLPGQALFQYRDEDGGRQAVGSGDVNEYLREAMGADFTAKDFRTWGATAAAFRRFASTELPPPRRDGRRDERAIARIENEAVAEVAQLLRNTPAICRKSYIHPAVLESWREGRLTLPARTPSSGRQWERAALTFLRKRRR